VVRHRKMGLPESSAATHKPFPPATGPQWELCELRVWRNSVTGATASIYGALPYQGENDGTWAVHHAGWGMRSLRGLGVHGKHGTSREEAQAIVDAENVRLANCASLLERLS